MKYISAPFLPMFMLAGALIAWARSGRGFEVVSPDGGFSYQLSKGWKLINAAEVRYKVAVDPHNKAKIVVNTNLAVYVVDDENGRNFLPIDVERFRYKTLKTAGKRDPDFQSHRKHQVYNRFKSRGATHIGSCKTKWRPLSRLSVFFPTLRQDRMDCLWRAGRWVNGCRTTGYHEDI